MDPTLQIRDMQSVARKHPVTIVCFPVIPVSHPAAGKLVPQMTSRRMLCCWWQGPFSLIVARQKVRVDDANESETAAGTKMRGRRPHRNSQMQGLTGSQSSEKVGVGFDERWNWQGQVDAN